MLGRNTKLTGSRAGLAYGLNLMGLNLRASGTSGGGIDEVLFVRSACLPPPRRKCQSEM